MKIGTFYNYVFRGLLTKQSLDRSVQKSPHSTSATIDQETFDRLSIILLDEDLVSKSRRMATVYIAISAFENSLRAFVSKKLIEDKGEDWWEKSVPEKIRKIAKSRQEEEQKYKWHSLRGDNQINYLEFGDIKSIIMKNWDLFEPHLNTQEWTGQILTVLEKSRNVIMHSGELDSYDIERIGTHLRDWIKQVG